MLEKPARGIYQEDNDQKSSFQSFYITDIFFLQSQIQWSTSISAQGVPFVSSEDEEASVVTAMRPSGCPVRRIPP